MTGRIIAFDFACDEAPLFAEVGRVMQREGWRVTGLSLGRRWRRFWADFETMPMMARIDPERDVQSEMERIERQYGAYFPAWFYQADRYFPRHSRAWQRAAMVETFQRMEHFFDTVRPDAYACTGIAYLYNLVSHCVCRERGIPHLSLYVTRGSDLRFTASTGVTGQWDLVNRRYVELAALPPARRAEVVAEAKAEIAELLASKAKPHYMSSAFQSKTVQPVFIREFAVRLKQYYLEGWGREAVDFATPNPFRLVARYAGRIAFAKLHGMFRDRIFDTPAPDDKFYLLPLHYQPEASTLILAHKYTNQMETVRQVAKCLPADACLYVKEHSSAFGQHMLWFYRAMKRIPNVKLISPFTSAQDFIGRAEALIVLSGTAGWEAAMANKRCFVLGDVFFDWVGSCRKISGFDELRDAIRERPTQGDREREAEETALYFQALKLGSFPGLFDVAKLDHAAVTMSTENISNVADGLMRHILPELAPDRDGQARRAAAS